MPDMTLALIIAAAAGYLLGSIPFGLVLSRMAGLGDIRQLGSGNIGATNVLRTGNKLLALAVLLFDSGKGAIAVGVTQFLFTRFLLAQIMLDGGSQTSAETAALPALFAGCAAVIGHNFPVWLGFKGGKGVATTLGTLIALAWPVGLAVCATWLAAAALFRISSLSALIALAAAPAYALLLPQVTAPVALAIAAGFLAVLGWVRHRTNIQRILAGEEPKIGKR